MISDHEGATACALPLPSEPALGLAFGGDPGGATADNDVDDGAVDEGGGVGNGGGAADEDESAVVMIDVDNDA